MHCGAGAVYRASQCLTAVLQGHTGTIRRAVRAGRSPPTFSNTASARCSLLTASGIVRRMVPQGHNGNIQTVTSEFLSADDPSPGSHIHLVLLNYILPPQTAHLWQRATTRICADGGANRLYDQLPAMLPGVDPSVARDSHLPDLIKGDLDSVRQDVTDFYTSKGIPFIDLSSDQETTDLEKCLLFLEGRLRAMSEDAARWSAAAHAPSAAVGSGHLHHKLAPGGCGATAGAAANTAARAPASDLLLSSSSSNSNGSSATPQHIGSSVTASLGLAPLTPGSNADGSSSNSQQQQPHGQISGEIVMLHDAPDQQQRLHNGRVSQESRSCLSHAGCTHSTAASAAAGNLDRNSSSDNGQQHAHEGTGSILASHDGVTVEHVKKRVHQEHQILVLGALGGRLDHTLANLNTLYCYPHLNITLWGDGNLVRLLRAGKSMIRPSRLEGPTCGLVPLARPAVASSRGLKWNLDNTHMCFRGLLSTSNIILSDTIEVSTDEDLLWITAVGDSMLGRGTWR